MFMPICNYVVNFAVDYIETNSIVIFCFAIDDATDTGSVVDVEPYWQKAGL